MPAYENDPGDVLTDARGVPLVVHLGSAHALNPELVGDGVRLLALAGRVGLPVADGVVVTVPGVENDDRLHALRHAWQHARGPVRLLLSDRGDRSGLGVGPSRYDASTWPGLLDGVHGVLAYDRLENPGRAGHPWAILVLKVPADGCGVIVQCDHRGRIRLWAADGRSALPWRTRVQLRALGRQVRERIGRPVSLEVMRSDDGDWVITDLRRQVCRIVRTPDTGGL